MNNFMDLLNQMTMIFPLEECAIKAKEPAIYEGNTEYLCMIIDKRFNNNIELRIMKPYIWVGSESNIKGSENEILCGWFDRDDNYVDNYARPIHNYNEFVVGFVKYENKKDNKIWEMVNHEYQ
jgi:hypothetical protein